MKRNRPWRWKPVVAVVAIGTFALGLTLQGAPPAKDGDARTAADRAGPVAFKGGARITIGPGVPTTGSLPVFAPVSVDYRKDPAPVFQTRDGHMAVGPRNLSTWEASSGMRTALTCQLHEECAIHADCNACLDYECDEGKCLIEPDLGTGTPDCDDGLYCNGEEECVDDGAGGADCVAGTPVTCEGVQVCDEDLDACVDPCSVDADCDDENSDTRDECDTETHLCTHVNIVVVGRCCMGAYPSPKVCQPMTVPQCETEGGVYLATANDPCVVVEPSGNMNDCPVYGSGIAPQGDYIFAVGPVSDLACDDLHSIGDDYQTQDYPDVEFMNVTFLRFAASVLDRPVNGARWEVAFHDASGLKVEDVFWPDGSNDSVTLPGIRTVDFDPPLTVPTNGFVVWSVQSNFGIDGRVRVLSTTCPADKGVNDCTSMYVNGEITAFIGVCSGGDRDGERCDVRHGNDDCTGEGTCDPSVPDVLAFELIGTPTTAPTEACCTEGVCTIELPWICVAGGGRPQGPGTLCGYCGPEATNMGDPCDEDDDCDGDDCLPTAACLTQACCNVDTGECIEATSPAECPSPTVPQGIGTDCDPNCCVLPPSLYTGGDNCRDVYTHLIQVPPLGGDPVVLTITGNNSAATFDDHPDICGDGIFDPDGNQKDRGWWESFTLTDCAEIRMEFCCSDVNGEPWRPNWANLWDSCNPCSGQTQVNAGIDPPLGKGRGTSGYARGWPFCNEDNLWMTFGPLPAGQYYYPMYSGPDGTGAVPPGAQYQINIHVGACPIAVCCIDDSCDIINEYECDQAGGYWHYGNVNCGDPPDPDCLLPQEETDNPCCYGACCLGPGNCVNGTGGPTDPIDLELCLEQSEDASYIGGLTCADNPCPTCGLEGDANCHTWDSNWYWSTDRINGGSYRVADDFIPEGTEIRQICWWGMYANAEEFLTACAPEAIPTVDYFEIRFYEDAGGKPGTELVGSPGPVLITAQEDLDATAPVTELYSVVFETPIEVVNDGRIYWVEISGQGDPAGHCQWWMGTSEQGNGYKLGDDDPLSAVWTIEDRTQYLLDWAICLDTGLGGLGITVPPEPTGACCECTGTCTDDVIWYDCNGGWTGANLDQLIGDVIGQWDAGETCPSREVVCTGEPPEGDDCDDPIILPAINPVEKWVTTWCSTTDGLSSPSHCECDNDDLFGFEDDIWVKYEASCNGRFSIDLCGDMDWNAVLSVYSDGTDTCPSTCPPPAEYLVENIVAELATCTDYMCNEDNELPSFRAFTTAGTCLLIRVGGGAPDPDGDYPDLPPDGRGLLQIECEQIICPDSIPPVPDVTPPSTGHGTKNRYLSFDPTVLEPPPAGRLAEPRALRVKFVTLPYYEGPEPPANYDFRFAEGRTMWVQAPGPVTEAAGSDAAVPPPTFLAATLGCFPDYRDWSEYGMIDVYDAGIIPGGTYDIQAIHPDCQVLEENFSDPLTVVTSAAGDVCGLAAADAPQGVVDFIDIAAVVAKFKNDPGSIRKARGDITGNGPGDAVPNRKGDFVDISCVVGAFRAEPCLEGPPVVDPCP